MSICPNCTEESTASDYCTRCGLKLDRQIPEPDQKVVHEQKVGHPVHLEDPKAL